MAWDEGGITRLRSLGVPLSASAFCVSIARDRFLAPYFLTVDLAGVD